MEHLNIIIPASAALLALIIGLVIGRFQGRAQAQQALAEQQLIAQQLEQAQHYLDAVQQRTPEEYRRA